MLAVIKAVKTKYAFACPDISSRLTAAFAGFFAQFAVGTLALSLADSPDCKPAEHAEQRAERADESAIEPRDGQIQQDRR